MLCIFYHNKKNQFQVGYRSKWEKESNKGFIDNIGEYLHGLGLWKRFIKWYNKTTKHKEKDTKLGIKIRNFLKIRNRCFYFSKNHISFWLAAEHFSEAISVLAPGEIWVIGIILVKIHR